MLPLLALLGAVTVPVTHPALYFSPYNTDSDGPGALLPNNVRAGSTRAVWVYPGSYLKAGFTGTGAALRVDTGAMEGANPKFRWSVDGGPFAEAQAGRGETALRLAAGVPRAAHTVTVWLAASDANYDRWQGPRQAVRILGLSVEGGEAGPPPLTAPRRAVFFGDSITEGAWNLGNSNKTEGGRWPEWVAHSDATRAWPFHTATALGFEYGAIGSGGMSWLRPSHSGIPPLPESWAFHSAGRRRLFHPAPDLVVVNMGTNDGGRDTAEAVEAWLRAVRRAIPPPAKIVVIVPFGGQNRASLERAVAAVQDPNVHKADLGAAFAEGLTRYGQPSAVSFDGLHPNAAQSRALGQAAARAIARLLEP